jgi:hypothetical protein
MGWESKEIVHGVDLNIWRDIYLMTTSRSSNSYESLENMTVQT